MNEAMMVEDVRQGVIGMVTEARARVEKQAERAKEIREREDLGRERKQQAIDEVANEARTRVTGLIRGAREHVSGKVVGDPGPVGGPIRNWQEGLSESGRAAVSEMFKYIDVAELAIELDVESLATGKALSAELATERDRAATEAAAYEEAHSAPPGVPSARDRWATIN